MSKSKCFSKLASNFLLLFGASSCIGASSNNLVQSKPEVNLKNEKSSHFPELVISDLEGKEHFFPQSFNGKHTLILFAFKREQQQNVDRWIEVASSLFERFSKFELIEMPVIERLSGFGRMYLNNAMRGGISDRKARERTLTIYVNKEEFRKILGLQNEDEIYSLLFDENGLVVWRAEGDFTAAKLSSLEEALAKLN